MIARFRYPTVDTSACLVLVVVMMMSTGCEQVSYVVDDVKSSVNDSSATTDSSALTESNGTNSPTDSTAAVATSPPPDPAQIVADFQLLSPERITDSQLQRLVDSPEAAVQIESLHVASTDFTVAGLRLLSKLENLKALTIASVRLTPDQLTELSQVQSLQDLIIRATLADDSTIAAVATLPELTSLDASATRISPAAAADFGRMKQLNRVLLESTLIDDSVVTQLAQLPLQHVDLSKTMITSASVQPLLSIDSLQHLNVASTRVTGDAFDGISRTNVQHLNISDTGFGIEGFANLKNMKSLEVLYAHAAGLVEHRRVDVFTSMPNLKVLRAGGNAITDAGMDVFFKGHRSLEELFLNENKGVTDRGLSALVNVKTLKRLSLYGTRCTTAGVQQLKQRLPDCEILM